MQTNKLSQEEYQQTFLAPMRDVTKTAEPILNIWPYVDAIPTADLDEFALLDGIVKHVYLHPNERYEHVLISTEDDNAFLVIIIDLVAVSIYGHHLLDLVQLYGLTEL